MPTTNTASPPDAIARLVTLGLTRGEARVFHCLFEGARVNGFQPSMRSLGAELGIRSPNAILECYVQLEKKGWIKREALDKRAVQFLKCPDNRPFKGFCLPD